MPYVVNMAVIAGRQSEMCSLVQFDFPNPQVRIPAPIPGQLANLVVSINQNDLDAQCSISLMVNGTPIATLPIAIGTIGVQVLPLFYPISAGALVSFLCNTLAATAGAIWFTASSMFVPTPP